MSPLKLLIYAVALYIVYRFVRSWVRGLLGGPAANKRPAYPASAKLVRCAACGTYIAENRARLVGEIGYCSEGCVNSSRPARG